MVGTVIMLTHRAVLAYFVVMRCLCVLMAVVFSVRCSVVPGKLPREQ